MKNNLKKGDKVTFHNDNLSYEVKAVSERYAVCIRKFDKKEDLDLLEHDVEMGGYLSIEEAYNHQKDNAVYTLLDFEEEKRASNNLVFSDYDYWKQEDCDKCIADLVSDQVELSHRTMCDLIIQNVESPEFIPLEKEWPDSSNVLKTVYRPGDQTLEVAFKTGTYQYKDVPFEVWVKMSASESVGSFIAKEMKGKYDSVKL